MSDSQDARASSRRDPYLPHEDALLRALKDSKPPMPWKTIHWLFNSALPHNRWRSLDGLKYEWRKIKDAGRPSRQRRQNFNNSSIFSEEDLESFVCTLTKIMITY
jgi:hypothetical protein